ncbi:MAG: DUF3500 domain-containing protein [Gemmataceae bacterium]
MTRSPLLRLSLAVLTGAALASAAVVATQAPPAGAKMADAANKFLATLSPEQKAKAAFGYDDPARTTWFFTPQQDKQKNPTRKGVRLEELSADQKAAAMDLVRAGLSGKGYEQASTIMSLESLLADLEGAKGAMVRNPNWYFVSVFGEPSATGTWGWRVEGHHLSVNVTLEKGRVVAASPVVFGANPAEVRQGPRKGLRTLPEIEDLAKELIASLTPEQREQAKQPKQLSEIKENRKSAGIGEPVGVPVSKLNEEQKATVWKLLAAYANRMPPEVAAGELNRVKDAGVENVRFAYCVEEDKKGKPYTYRLHGPTVVVEFLNVQADSAGNPGNHIHSGWRRLPADFGLAGK